MDNCFTLGSGNAAITSTPVKRPPSTGFSSSQDQSNLNGDEILKRNSSLLKSSTISGLDITMRQNPGPYGTYSGKHKLNGCTCRARVARARHLHLPGFLRKVKWKEIIYEV